MLLFSRIFLCMNHNELERLKRKMEGKENSFMQYTKAFFIKYGVTLAALILVLGLFFNAQLVDILIIGTVLTIIAFLGDMFILPNIGNIWAAFADFVIAFLGIWAMGSLLFEQDQNVSIMSASFLAALFVFGVELYYHRYLRYHVFVNVDQPNNITRARKIQTEYVKEFIDPELQKSKNNMS